MIPTDYSGFKNQCLLLARLIGLVETNTIQVPLYTPDSEVPPGTSNSVFLSDFLVNLMKGAFPHLAPYEPRLLFNSPKCPNTTFREWLIWSSRRSESIQAQCEGFSD